MLNDTNIFAGMGAIVHAGGVAFRVWAPHAISVSVIGSFNDWQPNEASEMTSEEGGCWYVNCAHAKVGDQYKFRVKNADQHYDRIDPRAREVTNSVGVGVVSDERFDWQGDDFQIANWNELVIYEMHVGTFKRSQPDRPGDFDDLISKLDYLRELGVNALKVMPIAEFAGDVSWGYNPAHIFAVESAYGGPSQFKRFVLEAHRRGLAVILDVVYNHFGPSDLDLWQFDGWSQNGKGGIYFYNDHRSTTPWGDTRPDYGRGEVRTYIRNNIMMWLEEFRIDGLRFDMTLFIRTIDGSVEIPEGWGLTQWLNREVHAKFPRAITIAEDLQNNAYLTKPESEGGAAFSSQWDAKFVHPIRNVLTQPEDKHRDMNEVATALGHCYNGNPFQRVVYTESHDEVANGKSRVPSEIDENTGRGRYPEKLAMLGTSIVLTASGIPMLFQGQEWLQAGWFQDTQEVSWKNLQQLPGIVQLHRDLISLRRNLRQNTAGLLGSHCQVFHVINSDKVVAYRRFDQGGPADDVIVIANFSDRRLQDYRVGVPSACTWHVRFNGDAKQYSKNFEGTEISAAVSGDSYDGQPHSVTLAIGPLSVLILSQDR